MLTVPILTAFVGLPFLGFGLLELGGAALNWRYRLARRTVDVLRHGAAVLGQVNQAQQGFTVRVNGRRPWAIAYQFPALDRGYTGQVSTLNQPGPHLQPGRPAWMLYLPDAPEHNALYPHP